MATSNSSDRKQIKKQLSKVIIIINEARMEFFSFLNHLALVLQEKHGLCREEYCSI